MPNPTATDAQGPLSDGTLTNPAFSSPAKVGDIAYADIAPAAGYGYGDGFVIPGVAHIAMSTDGVTFGAEGDGLTLDAFNSTVRVYFRAESVTASPVVLSLPASGFYLIGATGHVSDTDAATGAVTLYQVIEEAAGHVSDTDSVVGAATVAPATTTFYPGDVARVDNINANFNTCRNATDGTTSNNDLGSDNWFPLVNFSAGSYYIYRGFLFFDTSSIPDGATITSATLRIRYSSTVTGSPSVCVQQATVASTTTVANADFDAFNATELASRVTPSVNTWAEFTLNASGLAAISKTGFTKLCIREAQDVDGSYSAAKYANVRTLDDSTYKPQLVVTYTV